MKRIVFAILIITVVFSIANAKYSGGSGTSNDPYLISTAEDMNQIGDNSADWDKHFKLTADINLSNYTGTEFSRIGTSTVPFNGVFNGDGHTIWSFTYTAENSDYIGIFSTVGGSGKIEDIFIADVNISGRDYIGGLAGYNEGTIDNCSSTGKITGGSSLRNIGGLVGENWGNISNCYSAAAVAGGEWTGYIGGLIGENYGDLSNCYAIGSVSGGDFSYNIGGLTGENSSGTISNCYAAGSVNGGDFSYNLGGLTGENYSTISNCYFLNSEPNNGYGEPLTDEQMKQQSSFVGWDFVWEIVNGPNDIWAMCEGVCYPKLAWQFMPGDCDNDKDVDFLDFARLALNWSQADPNVYCGGTDLTGNGWIDYNDLVIMCSHWLEGA